jgi:WD40 repeat protein
VLLSADGRTLLKVSPLGDIHQLDLGDAKNVREVVKGAPGPPPVGALSPDGKLFAATRLGQTDVVVSEVASGKVLHRIPRGRQNVVNGLTFSADGKVLAFAGAFPAVTLWDVSTGKPAPSYTGAVAGFADRCLFSANGQFLIGLGGNSVKVWGGASGQMLRELELCRGQQPLSLALSPDGRLLAVADHQAIRLWDFAAERESLGAPDHTGEITAARFTPDGAHVTTVGADLRVCQWDAATGRRTLVLQDPPMFASKLLLAPDGQSVFYSTGPGVGIRRVSQRAEERLILDGQRTFSELFTLSSDGKVLICGGYLPDGRHQEILYDAATGKETGRLAFEPGVYSLTCRALSPDHRTLVGGVPGTPPLRFWDARTGNAVPVPKHPDGPGFPITTMPQFLTYSPDGRTLVAGTPWPSLWEVASGRPRFRMTIPAETTPTACAFSADGTLLAVGTHAGAVHVIATATGEELGRLTGHRGPVTALDFAPDAARLLSGGSDTTVMIWDVKAWRDRARPAPVEVTAEALPDLWKDLADANAAKAYRAVLALAAAPRQSVPFLDPRLPRRGPDEARIERLIRDLDADDFDVREKATADLDALGAAALPALRRALDTTKSVEVRERATRLVKRYKGDLVDLNDLRLGRSLEVLERAGSPEAVALLEALAKGDPTWRLADDARAALARLATRKPK